MVLDCVKSFRAQVPPGLEVVVVDAGEAHVDEAALKALWPSSRVIRSEIKNAAAQRNDGVRLAVGEIIIFLDDDCYVQPGWWPAIIEPLQVRSVAAVAGGVWCNPNPKLVSKRGGYVNIFGVPIQVTHRGPGAPREVDWALTTNMAVRKSTFLEVGGFAEIYGIYDEDVDLGLKIKAAGGRIVFESSAAVYHYFTRIPRGPKTKHTAFRAGRNRALLLTRNYRLSPRVLLFFAVEPFVQFGIASLRVLRNSVNAYGHAASYLVGMMKGFVEGIRNPRSSDKEQRK